VLKLKVKWLEHLLGDEWKISPAGGLTGDAYFAQNDGKKLFLKRNSSPFLAVLSAEGIVPKLVWTKRLENGDVITAQHWISARELKPSDMNKETVAQLLHKIHHSKELLDMLTRLGKEPVEPGTILDDIKKGMALDLLSLEVIQKSLDFLLQEMPNVKYKDKVVCHCDLNHNNWLLSHSNELFLIDWDGAVIADPAIDLCMLLYWYIPEQDWQDWLSTYGIELTDDLRQRMHWYVIAQTILSVQWYHQKNIEKEKLNWLNYLERLLPVEL
jgi:thiamine kinase-like enzyme